MNRILGDRPPAEKQGAHQLFAWIVCATRPLKWHEIQGVAAIDLEKGDVDMPAKSWQVDHTALCGSLVERHLNGELMLVHSTAKSYVRETDMQLNSLI